MPTHRTDWFRDAGWGVFCDFLVDTASNGDPSALTPAEWNRLVDAVDVRCLADQIESAGARFAFATIGQNSGFFCAPNDTYDEIVGIKPSKLSRRDLVSDMADELRSRGIHLLVYVPNGAPASDPVAIEKLGWEWGYEGGWPNYSVRTGKRLAEFQLKWEAVLTEWSLRFGDKVRGWWVDGCYFADEMYRHEDAPNFHSFAAALRAGNPEAILAFSSGVKYPIITMTEVEDYTAGEVNDCEQVRCEGRWVGHAQWFMMSYLGKTWGQGPIRYSDEQALAFTRDAIDHEGVVVWDVPTWPTGLIPDDFLEQLRAIGKGLQ